jgi:hypothetical protein
MSHLASRVVETSVDGESWREVAREDDNDRLNDIRLTHTFAVARGGGCRLIRLANVGRSHKGNDIPEISAREVFGNLIK